MSILKIWRDIMSILSGKGKVKLDGQKGLTKDKPILTIDTPDVIYVPLVLGVATDFDVHVKEGDHVCIGTKLATRKSMYVPIYSPVSGTVKGIEKRMHASKRLQNHIVIENDHKDERVKAYEVSDPDHMSQEDVIKAIKELGIVGLGAIGQATAALCHAFGCRIIAYNPRIKEAPEYIEQMPLGDVLAQSDIVTLHCPLNSSTRGMIGKDELAKMKPTAFLINTARGPVVDSDALCDALNSGKIAGAGIDVFEKEPPLSPEDPLLQAKNTVVTPHVAFATQESMLLRAQIVFDTLDAWLKGERKNIIL